MFSMATALTPNIQFKINAAKKGKDTIPFNGYCLVKQGKGPLSINLVMPNEPTIKLIVNVKTGTGEMGSLARPVGSGGANPCVAEIIARLMCTLNNCYYKILNKLGKQ